MNQITPQVAQDAQAMAAQAANLYPTSADARAYGQTVLGQGLKIIGELPPAVVASDYNAGSGARYVVQLPDGRTGVAQQGANARTGDPASSYVISMPPYPDGDTGHLTVEKYFANLDLNSGTATPVSYDVNESPTQGFWQNPDNIAMLVGLAVGGYALAGYAAAGSAAAEGSAAGSAGTAAATDGAGMFGGSGAALSDGTAGSAGVFDSAAAGAGGELGTGTATGTGAAGGTATGTGISPAAQNAITGQAISGAFNLAGQAYANHNQQNLAAQQRSNAQAAQFTPYSVNTPGGNTTIDPRTHQATVSLSPTAQGQYDTTNSTATNLLGQVNGMSQLTPEQMGQAAYQRYLDHVRPLQAAQQDQITAGEIGSGTLGFNSGMGNNALRTFQSATQSADYSNYEQSIKDALGRLTTLQGAAHDALGIGQQLVTNANSIPSSTSLGSAGASAGANVANLSNQGAQTSAQSTNSLVSGTTAVLGNVVTAGTSNGVNWGQVVGNTFGGSGGSPPVAGTTAPSGSTTVQQPNTTASTVSDRNANVTSPAPQEPSSFFDTYRG